MSLTPVQVLAKLRAADVFAHAPRGLLETLADTCRVVELPASRAVVTEGDHGEAFYVIAKGCVRVCRSHANGEVVELVRRWEPETFGELALLGDGRRTGTVETVTRSTLLAIPKPIFLETISEPSVARHLLHNLAGRVSESIERECDMMVLDIKRKVARRLLELRSKQQSSGLVPLFVHQQQLAEMVGGSRQRVNVALRSLNDDGYIRLSQGKIHITDGEALGLLVRT